MTNELKYDKSTYEAIKQIYDRKYAEKLVDYTGKALLVGINYDKEDKKHTCKIEKITNTQ